MMEHVFSIQAVVRGYHHYKAIWDAAIDGKVLSCEKEVGNIHDTLAVTVKKMESSLIIAHRRFLLCAQFFIRCVGSITCQVKGNKCYPWDLPQRGLEVPDTLTFHTSKTTELDKIEKLIKNALSTEIELPLQSFSLGGTSKSHCNCTSKLEVKSSPAEPQIKSESMMKSYL